MIQQPRHRRRPAARGDASWVVGLSLATSVAAHASAGGVLPGPAGSALLLLATALLWLLASRTVTSRAGLLLDLVVGQLVCHVAYRVGSLQAPTFIVEADGTRHWGDPMAGVAMAGHAGHTMAGHAGHTMAGMHPGGHAGWSMLLAHAAAVLVSAALVLVLRRLPEAARHWVGTLLPTPPLPLPVPPAPRAVTVAARPTARWRHGPPPPRRGPPAPAC